jgi:hypothetical protein
MTEQAMIEERMRQLRWRATEKHFPDVAAAIQASIVTGELTDAPWEQLSLDGFLAEVAQAHDQLSVFATLPILSTTPTTSGDFRLITQDLAGLATVEWIGSPTRVEVATLTLGLPNDQSDLAMRNLLLAKSFVSFYSPDFGRDWVNAALGRLTAGPVIDPPLTMALVSGLVQITVNLIEPINQAAEAGD